MWLRDVDGAWVRVAKAAFKQTWWRRQRRAAQRRPWPTRVYPLDLEIDWGVSQFMFLAPHAEEGRFVHRLPDAVLKWVARARTGALATRARVHGDWSSQMAGSMECSVAGSAP